MTDPVNELQFALGTEQLLNQVQITIYPEETVGALQVIWTARATLRVAPGQSRVVYALFRDDNGERVGAQDVASLVANTDYTVNGQSDGSGFDYTTSPSFSITMDVEATRAKITLGNTATGPLYVTLLQVRGKPIRVYDSMVIEEDDATSQTTYQKQVVSLDLSMCSDPVYAQAYAEYLVGRFATPALVAEPVVVCNRAVINSVNVFSLGLLDRVRISDTHVGASNLDHELIAVEYDITDSGFRVTLFVERADERAYWLLGKTDYGELDNATRLGF